MKPCYPILKIMVFVVCSTLTSGDRIITQFCKTYTRSEDLNEAEKTGLTYSVSEAFDIIIITAHTICINNYSIYSEESFIILCVIHNDIF